MFKSGNTFEDIVSRATSEKLTSENWELILEICDRISEDQAGSKDCFAVINKRILHRNPNVVYYTLTLIESLVKNCGKAAQEQVASRVFTTTLIRILADKTVDGKIKQRILGNIQQWAFEFRQDPDLSLMEETFKKLQAQGKRFPAPHKPQKIPKKSEALEKEEEEHLQLALALSLSDIDNKTQTSSQIRNEITRQKSIIKNDTLAIENEQTSTLPTQTSDKNKSQIKVKALFDFKPTESGELGFFKGDVIVVLDQKYQDWWRGELRNKRGIFPANFVQPMKDPKSNINDLEYVENLVLSESHNVEVLLRMLSRMDPEKDNISENTELQTLYSSTLALRPKIVKLIEEFSKKKDEYLSLNEQLDQAINTYQELLEPINQAPNINYQQHKPYISQQYPNSQQHAQIPHSTNGPYYSNPQQGYHPNQDTFYGQYHPENHMYPPQHAQHSMNSNVEQYEGHQQNIRTANSQQQNIQEPIYHQTQGLQHYPNPAQQKQ
ncbi:hypothetical protein BB561_002548 [Smittium simulii]|uniref:Class E vacuolar protein-sorting machinery protein HSE1 n=1 Tax=Smittium simulii TaxID=133385 RepID=A0A2T9YQ25_9FUNG|nr:hypothetical protein BB561_002548 [Smittium simulii]